MVPVPEEHVEEVMQFMLRAMARANLVSWDAEAVIELFDQTDEFGRSLMAFVARAGANGRGLPEADATKLLQLRPRETIAVLQEINTLSRDMERMSMITRRTVAETQPNGRTTDVAMLVMEPDLIELVNLAVERDHGSAAGPLSASS